MKIIFEMKNIKQNTLFEKFVFIAVSTQFYETIQFNMASSFLMSENYEREIIDISFVFIALSRQNNCLNDWMGNSKPFFWSIACKLSVENCYASHIELQENHVINCIVSATLQ